MPIGVLLTPGEAHDVTVYDGLMAERDSDPAILLGDKGYDSDPIRRDVSDRGGAPKIPTNATARASTRSMPCSTRCAPASNTASTN